MPIAKNPIQNLSTDAVTDLKLICAPDKDGSFELYEDDGSTLAYQSGEYLRTKIDMKAGEQTVFSFNKEGNYETKVETIHLDVIYPENAPFKVIVDSEEIPQMLYEPDFIQSGKGWYYDQSLKSVQIKYPNIAHEYSVVVDFSEVDLIGM